MCRVATFDDSANIAVLSAQVWLHNYATEGINTAISDYVLSEFTSQNIAKRLNADDYKYIVSEHDGNLTGLISLDFSCICPITKTPAPELDRLYIQEPFTGHGLGSQLLKIAIKECKNLGYERVWLTVNHKNTRARAFYNRHGFEEIGETYFVLNEEQHLNYVLSKSIV